MRIASILRALAERRKAQQTKFLGFVVTIIYLTRCYIEYRYATHADVGMCSPGWLGVLSSGWIGGGLCLL